MALVTEAEVKELIAVAAGKSVATFIETAHTVVNELFVLPGTTLSADTLKQVELYLAAHFTAISEERGGITSTQQGSSKESYAGLLNYGKGLTMTRFGQQAMILDTTGTLSSLAEGKQYARFRVI